MPKKAIQTSTDDRAKAFGPGGIAVHPRGLGRLGEEGLGRFWERGVKWLP